MMTGCNLWLGLVLSVWVHDWMLLMSFGLGLCGLLPRPRFVRLGGNAADAHEGGRCVYVSGFFCCTPAGS